MDGYPKTVRVRGGLDLIVRPLEKKDFEELHRFFGTLPDGERLFLREDVTQREVVQRFIDELDYARTLPLLGLTGGRIVGNATLHRTRRGWMRHVGEVRVVVSREAQRHGVATALVRELCGQAITLGLDKLVAMVAQDQVGALLCFERLGFGREATLKSHVTDLAGQKRDLIVLANHTAELWHRMEDLILDREFQVEQ
ncbi:MAG: GNAT family N-acetyltransferase [Deltaproteobacteria bacterium]|nr:GNAT family N-acetyltransferase [Deltaproteobacteria bacterium]